jgi:hypothetical protein
VPQITPRERRLFAWRCGSAGWQDRRVAAEFLPGTELAARYYRQIVRPFVDEQVPGLQHSAALIGCGSDVLGFDTQRSTRLGQLSSRLGQLFAHLRLIQHFRFLPCAQAPR